MKKAAPGAVFLLLMITNAAPQASLNELQFVSGETNGDFRIRLFNVREKSAFNMPGDRLVRFVD